MRAMTVQVFSYDLSIKNISIYLQFLSVSFSLYIYIYNPDLGWTAHLTWDSPPLCKQTNWHISEVVHSTDTLFYSLISQILKVAHSLC